MCCVCVCIDPTHDIISLVKGTREYRKEVLRKCTYTQIGRERKREEEGRERGGKRERRGRERKREGEEGRERRGRERKREGEEREREEGREEEREGGGERRERGQITF